MNTQNAHNQNNHNQAKQNKQKNAVGDDLDKIGEISKIGSKVIIKTEDNEFTGILLKSAELGSGSRTLLLKLESGYNIGIDRANVKSIRILEQTKELEKFPAVKVAPKQGLPRVAMIATGGTIGSRVDYKTGGVHMLMKPEELLANVPELLEIISLERIERPFSLASEDMSPEEWKIIAKHVADALHSGLDGVIITHGTDTLHYTGAALSFMLSNLDKPVALVGGQRSSDRGSFDGALNLICAAHYMKSGIGEVALVMHGSSNDDYCLAIRGCSARKMHTSRRDAFRPINQLPLAKIWPDGRIENLRQTTTRYARHARQSIEPTTTGHTGQSQVKLENVFENNIALIKTVPGSDPSIIEHYMKQGVKGIVIEGTGLGHVPTQSIRPELSWIPAVRRASESGAVIVVASQCIYGRTNQEVYSNLRLLKDAGAICSSSMTAETAYVKLGWALAKAEDKSEAERLMLTNIAGEIIERTEHEAFLY